MKCFPKSPDCSFKAPPSADWTSPGPARWGHLLDRGFCVSLIWTFRAVCSSPCSYQLFYGVLGFVSRLLCEPQWTVGTRRSELT